MHTHTSSFAFDAINPKCSLRLTLLASVVVKLISLLAWTLLRIMAHLDRLDIKIYDWKAYHCKLLQKWGGGVSECAGVGI